MMIGQRRVTRDEPGMAPHQLHQAHSVCRRLRLHLGRRNRLRRNRERRLETETLSDERNVVVDRLGDADHSDRQTSSPQHVRQLAGAADRPVATDDEQDVDAEFDESVDHHLRILRAPGGAEDGAALLIDLGDPFGGQLHGLMTRRLDQAGESIAETHDIVDAVVRLELHHQATDDVIESGTQTPAGDDADLRRPWRVEHDPARAARFQGGHLAQRHSV
jgi:hypothetical protein